MFTYRGGNMAGKGTYWDMMTGHRVDLSSEDILPGESKNRYLKVSSVTLLLVAPIIGLAYFVFLPIMGVMTVAAMVVRKAFGGMFNLGKNMVAFGWRPSEAYLAGKNKKQASGQKAERSGKN